ncbi:glycosyltransferase family 39 protein [Alloacidobacterium dinghuense]|uniref:Glycosyltransferase family 39 protein n=1 Tax=Alloacidobacterium dinghuense TaxID=2763107 RepID=A0A7G8BI02_9BACT|nr:glycosyltransferase family 39 protein [Alloacidobacterium dinghuense]QNI32172.1 glycosyltransferase family 39 protein [Alloacidobacterium dinghuense]
MLVALPRKWWIALLALAAGAMLRLWFIHAYPEVQGDPLIYGDIAKNWMLHGIYGLSGGQTDVEAIRPTLIRLPGYPLFLVLCFRIFGIEHYHAVMYVQTGIDLLTCLLIAGFTAKIASRRAAWVALWLAVLCPFTANYAATPLTETLELFSIALALLSFACLLENPEWRWVLVLAFAFSYAAILRPDGALLAVALCPAIVAYGAKLWGMRLMLRMAVVCGVLSVLPFVPWAVRNWRTFHVIQPLAPRYATDPGEATNPGFNRWTKTVCADLTCTWEIYWNANSDALPFDRLPNRAFDSLVQYAKTKQLFADYNKTTTLSQDIDDRFGELAQERISADPLRYYVGMPMLRLADMWLRPRTELLWIELRWWEYSKHHAETEFALAYAALNLAYIVLALIGLYRSPRFAGAMLLFILLRCALLATIEAPEPRYTLECFPILIALGGVALERRDAYFRLPI